MTVEVSTSVEPVPTPGRIVTYTLSEWDVAAIGSTAQHNPVRKGDEYPAILVRVWNKENGLANLQVFLDGNCTYWATSRSRGDDENQWHWPTRV